MSGVLDDPTPLYENERDPDDFERTRTGAPIVNHPTDTARHTGNKPELLALCHERGIDVPEKVTVAQLHDLLGQRPRRAVYGRPSGFGAALDPDPHNLKKWNERQVVIGLARLPQQHLDAVDIDDKGALDGLVAQAHDAADTKLSADRGTHIHLLTQAHDDGR